MVGDKICVNGKIVSQHIASDVDSLLAFNYVYQDIHTLAHEPLFIGRHLDIAQRSFEIIHGRVPQLSVTGISECIAELLRENRYPKHSNLVRLYLTENGWMLTCLNQLVYEGFVLWHTRMKALVSCYETPFPGHSCAVTLMSAKVARDYGVRFGVDTSLHVNYDDIFTGVGDYPLVGVRNGEAYISPLSCGAAESVWRDLTFKVCQRTGITLNEEPLYRSIPYDELFFFAPQGITNIMSCDDQLYFNTTSTRVADALPFLI